MPDSTAPIGASLAQKTVPPFKSDRLLGLDPEDDRKVINKIQKKLMYMDVLRAKPGKDNDRRERMFVFPGEGPAKS